MKIITIILAFVLATTQSTKADNKGLELNWPIEIESDNGIITTLYQPQLESFKDNILEGRMALTIKPKDKDLIFGALWFRATMSTDLENRIVVLEKMHILKTHFPEIVDEEKISKFSELLSKEIESWDIQMSLDRLLAGLEEVAEVSKLSDQINNDPPHIYFRTTPAVLMMIDGDPIFRESDVSDLEYVVNTPFFIVKYKNDYFIKGGKFWYLSKDVLTGWKVTKHVPSKVSKFAEKNQQDTKSDSITNTLTEAPEIIVDTKAAELITVEGKVDYKAIEGTSLLYVANTESDIVMDINNQYHYVLLAGRWYYSKSLEDGDWKFCEPGDLPEDFSKIPQDSDMNTVLPSIPGTPEAQTALLEQSIPQTAEIDRKTAKVEVSYDGNPKFEKVDGTDVSYALNTDKTVLLIDNKYYCVDNAVWFVSNNATGPWEVCVERPEEVNALPPDSPVYNVKYAYIYDSSPTIVYVGYLPGYTNCYVYNGVVVYGTGYYYRPWYGHYYYPRPVTWGFGVHYNPWTGWGFSFGFSYGWMSWSFHPHRAGYWGPRGYYGGYRHGYHHGYRHGYNRGYRAGYAAGNRNAHRNVYNNRTTGVRRTGDINRSTASRSINNRARSTGKANNMFTDRSGNVYQRNNNGNYENRTNNRSRQTREQPSVTQQNRNNTNNQIQQRDRSSQPQRSNRQVTPQQRQQFDRSHQNRSRGTQNYNRSRQQMQRTTGRPAGGGRRR